MCKPSEPLGNGESAHLERTPLRRPRGLTRLARRLLEPALRVTDLDLRAALWRLDNLPARQVALSAILSLDGAPGPPSDRLLDLAPALIARARTIRLPLLEERGAPAWALQWPGDHNRLLAALVAELQPRQVVDIGTFTGISCLSLLSELPPGARLTTVDLVPWRQVPGSEFPGLPHRPERTYLREADFADGRLTQIVGDLGQIDVVRAHAATLRDADLVFLDAAADGIFERRLLANLQAIGLKPGALLVIDDIRSLKMLAFWHAIGHPKLDFTSFGHYAGTGLVDWQGRFRV